MKNLEKIIGDVRKHSKNVRDAMHMFVGGITYTHSALYALPTAYCLERSSGSGTTKFTTAHHIGAASGVLIGMGLLAVQSSFYASSSTEHPEFLLVPLATNIVSLVYEYLHKINLIQ